jgi:hypothetical protein
MRCHRWPNILPLTLLLTITAVAHADKPRKAPPPLPAAQYASHETHTSEHVTIAADPGDSKDSAPNTRLDYRGHGFMPIRIIVSNDSDQPLNLDDARILFVSSQSVTENAATPDELERGLFSTKSIHTNPVPYSPVPIHTHPPSVDKQIRADDDDFGFKSTTIPPHTTAAGWLYYDMRNLDEPVLKGATIELRKVRWAGTNQALDTFEIPLVPISDPSASGKSSAH